MVVVSNGFGEPKFEVSMCCANVTVVNSFDKSYLSYGSLLAN